MPAPVADLPDPLAERILPRDDAGTRLLVLLHGYGLPPEDLTDRLEELDPDHTCTVAVPTAPYDRKGRPIWHRGIATSPEQAAAQFRSSLVLLDDLLGRLGDATGLDPRDAIVGGFSQGGGLGIGLLLAAGMRHRPAAAFGVCSFAPAFAGFEWDSSAAAGRPCFLASAARDHFAPIGSSRSSASQLLAAGLDLTYVELDGGHEMTDHAAGLVGRWLAPIAAGRRTVDFPDLLAEVGAEPGFYDGLWIDRA